MDTETFLVARNRMMARLANRRQSALDAAAQKNTLNGSWLGPSVPFWLRFALNTFMPKRLGGFWPQALITAAPVVFGIVKSVTSQFRSNTSTLGSILGFFPIVKSLIKRYQLALTIGTVDFDRFTDGHRNSKKLEAKVSDCLFCRIVAREIPASIVSETSTTLAFRDIHPQAPTHVLVIPKEHIASMAALDETHSAVILDITRTIQDVARLENVTAKGFRVVVNNGKDANQAVAHLHYHVLGGRQFSD